MSEAERRRLRRQALEEQLRQLDEEDRTASVIPVPSKSQVHDYLRHHMKQPHGLETAWQVDRKPLDAYALFTNVVRMGGSSEVSARGGWPTVAEHLNLLPAAHPRSTEVGQSLRTFFLQLMGGLEVLWDQTKTTDSRPSSAEPSRQPTPPGNPFVHHVSHTSSITHAYYPQPPPRSSPLSSYPPPLATLSRPSPSGPAQSTLGTKPSTDAHAYSGYPHPYAPPSWLPRASAEPTPLPRSSPTTASPQYHSQTVRPTAIHTAKHPSRDSQTPSHGAQIYPVPTPSPPIASAQRHLPPPNQSGPSRPTPTPRPTISTFSDLVASNILPLPPPGATVTHPGPALQAYARRCHDLRTMAKRWMGREPGATALTEDEMMFWTRLLSILRENPAVMIPAVEINKSPVVPPRSSLAPVHPPTPIDSTPPIETAPPTSSIPPVASAVQKRRGPPKGRKKWANGVPTPEMQAAYDRGEPVTPFPSKSKRPEGWQQWANGVPTPEMQAAHERGEYVEPFPRTSMSATPDQRERVPSDETGANAGQSDLVAAPDASGERPKGWKKWANGVPTPEQVAERKLYRAERKAARAEKRLRQAEGTLGPEQASSQSLSLAQTEQALQQLATPLTGPTEGASLVRMIQERQAARSGLSTLADATSTPVPSQPQQPSTVMTLNSVDASHASQQILTQIRRTEATRKRNEAERRRQQWQDAEPVSERVGVKLETPVPKSWKAGESPGKRIMLSGDVRRSEARLRRKDMASPVKAVGRALVHAQSPSLTMAQKKQAGPVVVQAQTSIAQGEEGAASETHLSGGHGADQGQGQGAAAEAPQTLAAISLPPSDPPASRPVKAPSRQVPPRSAPTAPRASPLAPRSTQGRLTRAASKTPASATRSRDHRPSRHSLPLSASQPARPKPKRLDSARPTRPRPSASQPVRARSPSIVLLSSQTRLAPSKRKTLASSKLPKTARDRLKVVIPIRRSRRSELIQRGHYNAFRDDDSDDEPTPPRALRPTKPLPRGSAARAARPSEPEAIPARFVHRPGPAMLEPFKSLLTEESLKRRAQRRECGWKGCDAVLGSEQLLRRHLAFRQHSTQGSFQAGMYGQETLWRCHWRGCEEPCFATQGKLEQHIEARHVGRILYCPYPGCDLTSPNISHLSRHVMKQHDDPAVSPRPLADLSGHLAPPPLPAQTIPHMARTDELTTPAISGSVYRSSFRQEWIRQKVQTHCFAGDDPVIHVEHPPHILEKVEDSTAPSVAEGLGEGERRKKRRLIPVVEIRLKKRSKHPAGSHSAFGASVLA